MTQRDIASLVLETKHPGIKSNLWCRHSLEW